MIESGSFWITNVPHITEEIPDLLGFLCQELAAKTKYFYYAPLVTLIQQRFVQHLQYIEYCVRYEELQQRFIVICHVNKTDKNTCPRRAYMLLRKNTDNKNRRLCMSGSGKHRGSSGLWRVCLFLFFGPCLIANTWSRTRSILLGIQ